MSPRGKTRIPREPMKKTSLSLPQALHVKLKIAAAVENRDMQDILADAIKEYLAKTGLRRPKA